MPTTGRAVVTFGQSFEIREYTVPDPAPGTLLIKQELAGICGTDLHNWQKGIPLNAYMKSGWRHFMDWWECHRGPQYWPDYRDCDHECEDCNFIDCDCADCFAIDSGLEDALCALLFNVMGYLHEILKEKFDG